MSADKINADGLQLSEWENRSIRIYSADGSTVHSLQVSPESKPTSSPSTKDKLGTRPKLLTRRQSYRFRELLRQSIINDCFELMEFEIDEEVREQISQELQFMMSTMVASYTVMPPEPVPTAFNPEKSYVSLFYNNPGALNEETWQELIQAKGREIRDRVTEKFNRDRELLEDDWSLLDLPNRRFMDRKTSWMNSVEFLGDQLKVACTVPQEEISDASDSSMPEECE